ncbi:cytochrome P450 [Fistulina hepatica ATCC 64428]|uniref:Cytochrome P450 n=1 Tax=Fistulina hepatica ATCC 64428 TaxID=1128425 RepID=A0A0D7A6U2_9AGAR|nr:cytochrome P450 [Fistulina hepatica ATCC 64428]
MPFYHSLEFQAPLCGVLVLIFCVYRRFTRSSIAQVAGPPRTSWLFGALHLLYRSESGVMERQWQEKYGDIVRIPGPLWHDYLLISDPRALYHVLQAGGYRFYKDKERSHFTHLVTGSGIVYVDGEVHKRQRKILLPGFGAPEAKSYVPVFGSCAAKMVSKWKDVITESDGQAVINVLPWLSRAALDALGQAVFDHNFGALDDSNNDLAKSYLNLLPDTFGAPSDLLLLSIVSWRYLPQRFVRYLVDSIPSKRTENARRNMAIANKVSEQLLAEREDKLSGGRNHKDIMSLMVQANSAEDPSRQLSHEEMVSQLRTLILAGHETTANTLGWTLLELARHPKVQKQLRHEIREAKGNRSGDEWTWKDYGAMPYLNAVIKESLRFDNVAPMPANRVNDEDEVLPLARPITLTTGDVVHELFIPKGTYIIPWATGHNWNRSIWGDDAHVFNPERWMKEKAAHEDVSLGMWANLMSFSAGIRGCMGWRFAVYELQAFLVEIVDAFEFLVAPEARNIRREQTFVMSPTIEGRVDEGSQLPLLVRHTS